MPGRESSFTVLGIYKNCGRSVNQFQIAGVFCLVISMSECSLKVIVAEDNAFQRMFLMGLLEKLGYTPIAAQDGLEALELLKKQDVQILLSDLQMPNLDGIDLTKEVRKLDVGHYIHIIMITGANEDRLRTEALDAGVDDFFYEGFRSSDAQGAFENSSATYPSCNRACREYAYRHRGQRTYSK